MAQYLYRYEAKGIQSYVLGTSRLREIAGGSAVVEGLEQLLRQTLAQTGGSLEAAAAGNATVLFPNGDSLRDFVRWWPVLVGQHAPGLQVVQAWVEVPASGRLEGSLEVLARRLAQERNRRDPLIPEAGPLLARASRTGRPAVARATKGSGFVDAATRRRERAARGGKGAGDMDRLLPHHRRDRPFVRDHSDFRTSDLAVVHIDGNDMGRLVMSLSSLADYKSFSLALKEATLAAATAAIGMVVGALPPDYSGPCWPVRPVVVGGDDVTVVTRAVDALAFTRTFIETFHHETAARERDLHGRGALGASAGIAFVKEKSPFSLSYDLAESLCAFAKERLRREDGPTPSAIAFHRPTASLHVTWEQILQTDLLATRPAGPMIGGLTMNPYLVAGQHGQAHLDGLVALAKAMKDLPRGGLREWARVAQHDPLRARDRWDRMQEVADASAWKNLVDALQSLGCTDGPWGPRGRTPLYDAITLGAIMAKELP